MDSIPDEREKYRQIKQINYKIMKLNMMGHGTLNIEHFTLNIGHWALNIEERTMKNEQ